jgi:hypothetical protein
MKAKTGLTTLIGIVCAAWALCASDGPLVGVIEWEPGLRSDATDWDKTDYWAAIALSPSTGKYGSSCEWTSRDTAARDAREKCNSSDARTIVMCCNGWCALALGDEKPGKDFGWGVGWGRDQETADRYALEAAHDRKLSHARVVYSVYSRQMRTGGAIAYSQSTGDWGYQTGGGRNAPYMALQRCKASDAKIIAQKYDCWMALALGDDKSAYGWGYAGNRIDAERNALEQCRKRTTHAKIVVSFCTNGVTH